MRKSNLRVVKWLNPGLYVADLNQLLLTPAPMILPLYRTTSVDAKFVWILEILVHPVIPCLKKKKLGPVPHSLQGLSSPTKDHICASCIGSADS